MWLYGPVPGPERQEQLDICPSRGGEIDVFWSYNPQGLLQSFHGLRTG